MKIKQTPLPLLGPPVSAFNWLNQNQKSGNEADPADAVLRNQPPEAQSAVYKGGECIWRSE